MTTLQPLIAGVIGGEEIILLLAVAGSILAFWIWMIVDCAIYEKEGSTKIAWMLVILFAGPIGAPLYFVIRKLLRTRQRQSGMRADVPNHRVERTAASQRVYDALRG